MEGGSYELIIAKTQSTWGMGALAISITLAKGFSCIVETENNSRSELLLRSAALTT